jgi:FkbM family methyltransferase
MLRFFVQKGKEFLLKLYLLPVNRSSQLAFSVRNRILAGEQHLKGLLFTLNKLRKHRDFGHTVVDVGCFNGSTTLFFLHGLRNVKVIGFEPGTEAYKQAVHNTKDYQSIQIENYALSDFCGISEFHISDNKVSSSLDPLTGADERFHTKYIEQVSTITMDEYFSRKSPGSERILALKLDVQGHELKVLKGAEQTLKNTLLVLTELSNHNSYKDGAQYFEVDQLLREKGFVLQNIFAAYSYSKCLYEFDAIYINKSLI